jgi:hypothetical protein
MLKASARNFGVWIRNRGNHSLDPGRYQGIGTWSRATVVSVWLERHIGSGASGFLSRLLKRASLSVLNVFVKVKSFTGDVAFGSYNYAAHKRARAHLANPSERKVQRASHHLPIRIGPVLDCISYCCCLH